MLMKNPPHPGWVVYRECIKPLGLTWSDAALALGVTRDAVIDLINGKQGITPEMAIRISKAFGARPVSWLIQQAQYDLAQIDHDSIRAEPLKRVGGAAEAEIALAEYHAWREAVAVG